MKQILMLLSNPFRPDPRVAREAEFLAESGYHVTVVCWDRQIEFPKFETTNNVSIVRIQNVHSSYGSGPKQLFYLPRFWREAIRLALDISPEAVHCHDLDTLYAGVQVKNKTGCCLIYDAHEDYPALMSQYLPGWMVNALSWWERHLFHSVDYTITASTFFADKIRSAGIHPVTAIGNYQAVDAYKNITPDERSNLRKNLGVAEEDLLVVYIGGFTRNRLLIPLIEAVQGVPHVQAILWGDGHQRQSVEKASKDVREARYCGWLPAVQVPKMMDAADVIYYCLNPDYPGAVYNAPNTLSSAMAAGRPIIANDVGDLGRIVRTSGCGILLEQVTSLTIRETIEALRDKKLRQTLGDAGRKAAEEKYNWTKARAQLSQVYAELLGKAE